MRGSKENPDSDLPASHPPGALQPLDFALPQLLPQPPRAFGLVGTLLAHIGLGLGFVFLETLPPPEPALTEVTIGTRNVTPLVAPPRDRPLSLPELMARDQPAPQARSQPSPATPAPKPAVPQIAAPARRPGAPVPELIAEAPPVVNNTQALPQSPVFANAAQPTPAPPVIQQTEQPAQSQSSNAGKIAFESPSGQVAAGRAPGGRVPMPQSTNISELGRAMSRPGSGGGLSVGDSIDAVPPPGQSSAPSSSKTQSNLQMLTTDTMGVDFKPYLVTVLASVRRNWLAILPESARMGRRGRVQVQFAISRDGSVPKLVISTGSGAEALDRAAVAGISASNPFPPLPSEFQGPQIRLQFTFAYNIQ